MSEAKRSEAKRGGGGGVVHEYEEGLLGGELDALADHVLELTDCEVGGYKVLGGGGGAGGAKRRGKGLGAQTKRV